MAQLYNAENKIFVITGGASGLGAEYAEVFLRKGAKGIVILDIAEEVGQATIERLNKLYNEKVTFIKCDVSKEEDITNAFDSVIVQFKQIDVIINNAGIMNDAPDMWRNACDVNWQGLVSFTLKGINHMRKDKGGVGGTIINISSSVRLNQYPFHPIYNGSKLAVMHFSQCLTMNSFYERTGIRVLTVCLGATETPLMDNLEAKSYDPIRGISFLEVVSTTVEFQKIESVVAVFVHMFENGAPGTIWLSVDDKPAKDITSAVHRIFQILHYQLYGYLSYFDESEM